MHEFLKQRQIVSILGRVKVGRSCPRMGNRGINIFHRSQITMGFSWRRHVLLTGIYTMQAFPCTGPRCRSDVLCSASYIYIQARISSSTWLPGIPPPRPDRRTASTTHNRAYTPSLQGPAPWTGHRFPQFCSFTRHVLLTMPWLSCPGLSPVPHIYHHVLKVIVFHIYP